MEHLQALFDAQAEDTKRTRNAALEEAATLLAEKAEALGNEAVKLSGSDRAEIVAAKGQAFAEAASHVRDLKS
jgi:hypothetical protein